MFHFFAHIASYIGALYFGITNPTRMPVTHCGQQKEISYCYYAGDADSTQVVYFLHGFANNEYSWSWNKYTKAVMDTIQSGGGKRPHVFAPTMNGYWWYVDEDSGQQLTEFARWAEDKILKIEPKDRVLYGDSMGGHNSIRWAVDEPMFFDKLVLTCPAIPAKLYGGQDRYSVFRPKSFLASLVIGESYAKAGGIPNKWLESLAEKFPPKTHIVVSDRDAYDFDAGGEELYQSLRRHPSYFHGEKTVSYEKQSISHCSVEAEGIAHFLMK